MLDLRLKGMTSLAVRGCHEKALLPYMTAFRYAYTAWKQFHLSCIAHNTTFSSRIFENAHETCTWSAAHKHKISILI